MFCGANVFFYCIFLLTGGKRGICAVLGPGALGFISGFFFFGVK